MSLGATSKSFYKRKLPSPPAVAFSSEEGIRFFQEALQKATATSFFPLVEQFRTQSEPAYCGLASVAMVLNALAIDPRRMWKAPWRWFDDSLLDCCTSLEKIKKEGVTLNQAACLARCNGARADLHSYGSVSLETFRRLVLTSCQSTDQHIIVSYSRAVMSQTGSGHFSPIGAYHAASDMVLILDTARFKYPPHWVPLELLFVAMKEKDLATNHPRGFLVLRAPEEPSSMWYTLTQDDAFPIVKEFLMTEAPRLIKELAFHGVSFVAILKKIVEQCPMDSVRSFIATRLNGCSHDCDSFANAQDLFISEFRALPLYQAVKNTSDEGGVIDAHDIGRITALMLLRTPSAWTENIANPSLQEEVEKFMDFSEWSLIESEIHFLRNQFKNLIALENLPSEDCLQDDTFDT